MHIDLDYNERPFYRFGNLSWFLVNGFRWQALTIDLYVEGSWPLKVKYMWHLALPRSSHIDFILMDMPVVFSESSTTSLGYLLCLFWTHFHFIDFWSCGSKNWLECSQLDHSIFPPYPKTQFGNHNPNIANLKNMITLPRSALWEATWRNHEVPWNQHWGQKFGQRIWMVKGTPYCSHPSMATWIYLHERLIFVIVNW